MIIFQGEKKRVIAGCKVFNLIDDFFTFTYILKEISVILFEQKWQPNHEIPVISSRAHFVLKMLL